MPNKRDPNKRNMGVWITEKEKQIIEKLAIENGMTKTEFAQYAFDLAIKNLKEKKNENTSKNKDK